MPSPKGAKQGSPYRNPEAERAAWRGWPDRGRRSHSQGATSPHWPGKEGAEGISIQFHSFSLLLLVPPLCSLTRSQGWGAHLCSPYRSARGPTEQGEEPRQAGAARTEGPWHKG